jgi:single-strand DNA-binding protein
MAADTNKWIGVARLTRDPELRHTQSGEGVCSLRVAFSTRKKEGGSWVDKSNYIDVVVWGNQGEACAQYLAKGRRVAIVGRLEWREWEATDGSGKRQAIEVVAESVQFLDFADDAASGSSGSQYRPPAAAAAEPQTAYAGAGGADDDIPF